MCHDTTPPRRPGRKRIDAFVVGALCFAAMTACAGPAAQKRSGPPVLFIHGFKGGMLQHAAGDTAWLTGAQALGLSTPDLRLPLAWDGVRQNDDGVRAKGPLAYVRVIPWLWTRAIYGPWLDRADRMGYPFETFAYDWRRDNAEAVAQLKAVMQKLHATYRSKVRVVAHSMGGLITLALLHEAPELFEDVVFAGVPFRGGIGILPDLHAGVEVGINADILTPQVAATFSSLYCLFGEDGTGLHDARGAPLTVSWFDVATWRTYGLGLFAPSRAMPADYDMAAFSSHLASALGRARAFRARMLPKAMPYPPLLAIIGRSRPTLVTAVQAGPKSVHGWDFETGPKAPGDGRVGEHYARPPEPLVYDTHFTDAEHSEMLNDPGVADAIRRWFAERDRAHIEPRRLATDHSSDA